ncbi:restriction system protein [Thiothrix eikelboomii]|uniref:Restriction system protein n=1 Tax=Thiothrix eikelboomii TaxID=92487 RepID=A0A1T4W4M0_9GAMM|nr:restriction endonuclease [Thiothrix eikelboomii]SKA72274.1 restriction system protein [Thiothrix eikelboomii]
MARVTYSIIVEHQGLGKWREIKGYDRYLVEQKARLQELQWSEQWYQKCLKEEQLQQKKAYAQAEQNRKQATLVEKEREKERQKQELEQLRQSAEDQTQEAQDTITAIQGILKHTLAINDAINWDGLKSYKPFNQREPLLRYIPEPSLQVYPKKPEFPLEPSRDDFKPKRTIMGKLIKSVRTKQDSSADSAYQDALLEYSTQVKEALSNWEKQCQVIGAKNNALQIAYEQQKSTTKQKYDIDFSRWESEKLQYEVRQVEENARIDQLKAAYFNKDSGAISDYCEMVLSASQYPDNFPQNFDLEYRDETGILIVNYALPALTDMPTLSEVKFVQSSRSFKESFLSEKAISSLYDEAIYQIALRTLHELFEADVLNALVAIVLNGSVTATDKTTGNLTTTCILSIQVKKEEFVKINLANVDPKACFKALKGVGSSKLHGMTAIAPILNISREDKRIVDSYDVADSLDSSVNLAAMDWEDFEHLIREVFGKEFSANGGEVKVTQASRDGGVDAIAFDPDPIRGGKIVIQAKRYTNTVGVSAVRDLFGTVQHEGATKGILVTTADYGPDAYEFIAGKPLSLLNGANLLYLLEKHGHQARIDIREAKKLMGSS